MELKVGDNNKLAVKKERYAFDFYLMNQCHISRSLTSECRVRDYSLLSFLYAEIFIELNINQMHGFLIFLNVEKCDTLLFLTPSIIK